MIPAHPDQRIAPVDAGPVRGFQLARRGMVALGLEVGAAELDGFALAAVAEFLDSRARLLADQS